MTALRKSSPTRNRLLGRLHSLRRELGLDEELYRDKLEAACGHRSASELSEEQLVAVCRRFSQSGTAKPMIPRTPQGRMLQALWISLWNLGVVEDGSDQALLSFVKRQTKIDSAHWLTRHSDVEKVAEALKGWATREGGVDYGAHRGEPPFMALPIWRVCAAQWRILEKFGAAPGDLHSYATSLFPDVAGAPATLAPHQLAFVSKKLGRLVRAAKPGRGEAR